MRINVDVVKGTIHYTVERLPVSVNIRGEGGVEPSVADFRVGVRSSAVALGREDDRVLISAFRIAGGQVEAKHLMIRPVDGINIGVNYLPSALGDYYGIRFGREHDLYNEYGIREHDFEFVFDPREPRAKHGPRNPTTVLTPRNFKRHHSILQGVNVSFKPYVPVINRGKNREVLDEP